MAHVTVLAKLGSSLKRWYSLHVRTRPTAPMAVGQRVVVWGPGSQQQHLRDRHYLAA